MSDYLASNVAWLVYNCVRYRIVDSCGGFNSLCSFLTSDMVLMGQLVFPLVMMAEYYFSGYYNEVFRKSRLQELFVTLGSALINSLIVFFIAMLNDMMRIKNRIRATLQSYLGNNRIEITFRLAEGKELKPILTKPQLFNKLKNENPAFAKLADRLSLTVE